MMVRLMAVAFGCAGFLSAQAVSVSVRTMVQPWKGVPPKPTDLGVELDLSKTALLIVDMWDKHWCRSGSAQVERLAPKVARVVETAGTRGMLVIHAPSETMAFYKDAPQRKAALAIPVIPFPKLLEFPDPPLPIDDSSGGCESPGDSFYKAWSRQHPVIPIGPNDLITDESAIIYSTLAARGIRHVVLAGVHTNMCVINRSFAIKWLSRWGFQPLLLRDLTDAMYNPADPPHVSHERGLELVIEFIEKNWCPTMLSTEFLRALSVK